MKKLLLTIIILSILGISASEAKESRILRYPNTSKTHVTFCHSGEVFIAPINGGLARRITTSDGLEMYPRFSPDGNTIAFSAEYDGNREIYTIPSIGGSPERLTYTMDIGKLPERMGPDKIIMQWSKDGDNVLYRSRHRSFNVLVGRLYWVDTEGNLPEEVPLAKAGYASYSPDGNKLAFNRIFREYRTWKRYRGGQADDIWIYDFTTDELTNISNNPAQDIIPMWHGNKIYYISDRDHAMNLFAYDITTKQTKKITNFTEFDVKFPSLGADHIAFENAGYIYLMDLATEEVTKIDIQLAEDFTFARNTIKSVKDDIREYEISPEGKRALFVARGEIFSVPAKSGFTYNLTETPGAHDRNIAWSPDGKLIAYVSDKTGTSEVYIAKPDGTDEVQLTSNGTTYRYEIMWSPDSEKLICSDKSLQLYYIDILTKKITPIAKSKIWELRDFTWSPDSKWIAYTGYVNNYTPVIYLYSLESNQSTRVTSEFFQSSNPEFSKDGKYLFFVSDRTFNASIGNFEYNFIYENMTKIYGLTLQSDVQSPFTKLENDRAVGAEDDEEADDDEKDEDEEEEGFTIDLDGIMDRIFEFPVDAGNYGNLTSTEKGMLYYVKRTDKERGFYSFNIEDKEETKVGDFSGYIISQDEKKIMYSQGKDYYISKLHKKVSPSNDDKIDLSELRLEVDRRAEWEQIYNEAWRQMKYFFYDPNMHQVDWDKIKTRYAALLPYVDHRDDLIYILSEMVSELNVGHAYVGGGDMPEPKEIPIGLLGAEFELDNSSGYYKITKILEGRNWDEKTRSPLTEPGLNVNEGDYLIAINGKKLSADVQPYELLVDEAGEFIEITVNSKPSDNDARDIAVKTIKNESELRYYNWVESNRRYVEEKTGGRVGYVHIPDMMPNHGLNEFVKYFYPQTRKEALIIDDRYNGGGNVSPMVIERLRRVLAVAKNARNQEAVFTTPNAVMTGPMVCLINEQSMSDGDLFPYQFKKMGLGKLIGKRTWGGVIGIRGSLPFIDGGYMHKPEFANFGADGTWILEGVGMEPDIEVDNHPGKEYRGIDQQLDKAIEVILEEIKNDDKPKIPDVPTYPDKK